LRWPEAARGEAAGVGAERIRHGKSWYWRLKKDYKFGDVIEL